MKFHWETKDVIPGRIVCKPRRHRKMKAMYEPDGWSAKWTCKIGFQCGAHVPISYKGDDGRYHSDHYCLIAMTDGMTGPCRSKADIAKWLNDNGMIPMPHEWLMKTIEFLKDAYQTPEES